MGSNIQNLHTSEELLNALERAASHRLTHSEILEQRVSFVYGSLNPESNITRERVKQIIQQQQEGDAMERVCDSV